MLQKQTIQTESRRDLDIQLDRLENKIAELRVLYEQYFIDVLPLAPDKQHQEVKRMIRTMMNAPFKNSANRFRLRGLVTRFQTYVTYWERVNKQREEGTYCKDQFKADMRDKMMAELERETSEVGRAEKGFKQLFDCYTSALKQTGANLEGVNFDSFKGALVKQAKAIREQHGCKKLHYKIVQKNGKVVVKAAPRTG